MITLNVSITAKRCYLPVPRMTSVRQDACARISDFSVLCS